MNFWRSGMLHWQWIIRLWWWSRSGYGYRNFYHGRTEPRCKVTLG